MYRMFAVCLLLVLSPCGGPLAIAEHFQLTTETRAQMGEIAKVLFNKQPANYEYNWYECCPTIDGVDYCKAANNGDKNGYLGGHSGWDAQTQSVAGSKPTVDECFHSLTAGQVIRARKDKWNTIAVYNYIQDKTTLYLHARRIDVSEGASVKVGDRLGIQGNTGVRGVQGDWDREHVHVEVQKGYTVSPALGAKKHLDEKDRETIDPIPYLYGWVNGSRRERGVNGSGGGGDVNGTEAFSRLDVNRDGHVNLLDLLEVLRNLETDNSLCDVNGDGKVDMEDCDEIKTYLDNSFRLPQTLENLFERNTHLLTNYPNPFNPETWIPYQLPQAAEVTISIHAADGMAVRMLDLGHRPAGLYLQRGHAAYWDGKNEFGEEAASGLYFYTLSAGDFNTTGRMVIRR